MVPVLAGQDMETDTSLREYPSLSFLDRTKVRSSSLLLAVSGLIRDDLKKHPWKAAICTPLPGLPPFRSPVVAGLTVVWYAVAWSEQAKQGRHALSTAFFEKTVPGQLAVAIDGTDHAQTRRLAGAVLSSVRSDFSETVKAGRAKLGEWQLAIRQRLQGRNNVVSGPTGVD